MRVFCKTAIMLIINTVDQLVATALECRERGKTVGLVPTMGALHAGHQSLIRQAGSENDIVFVSIFVNPVQFDNLDDLQKYPRTLDQDVALIGKDADYVFAPSVEEVFPTPPTEQYHFGAIEEVMEGAARPGHFKGVGVIVGRLLQWVNPHRAYFGEKDYQQIAVIRELVRQIASPVEIKTCPIVRESNGLAISSRNRRLSAQEFETAGRIHQILETSKMMVDVPQIKRYVEMEIDKVPEFRLDYFEVADDATLQSVKTLEEASGVMGFIALYVGDVRLIDNVRYK